MWTLKYTREVNSYALDSYPYNEELLIAIEPLAQTESGLPSENLWEWKPAHYVWEVAGHSIAFQRIFTPQQTLFIIAIVSSQSPGVIIFQEGYISRVTCQDKPSWKIYTAEY